MEEIREHLEKAQNPIFYYDNDADGLCSFLILRRYIGRGKGVAIRSFPELDEGYARKAQELKADYVFVLDKPVLSEKFVKEIDELGLPFVWIDHHDLVAEEWEKNFDNFYVYNPARNSGDDKSTEPVTYLSYKITNRKEDLWLGIIGCISDHYLPDFAEEFKEKYSEFWGKVEEPFDAYFNTEIGKIAMAFNFGLKDSVSNVVRMQNFLISCQNPGDVLQEVSGNYSFRKKHQDIMKKYYILLEKAKECVGDKLLFFEYSGMLSISADLSNELLYRFPGKYIIVAYRNGAISNLSIRGDKVKNVLAKVFEKMEGSGGGHENAVGARVATDDLQKFKEIFTSEIV